MIESGLNKKTTVYVDFANLMARCKQDSVNIDFKKFYIFLSERYNTKNIILFSGYFKEKQNEYNINLSIGYIYSFKDIIYNKEESKIKANCDVDITIKCMQDIYDEKPDQAVLISSDGDFAGLIKLWQSKNIKVTVISPATPDRCSYLLKKTNAPIVYLRQIIDHFRNEKALDEDDTS